MQTPDEKKVQIEDNGHNLKLTVPNRMGCVGWFIAAFLGFWLMGWATGEISVIKQLISGKAPPGALIFMGIWLIFWTIGGAAALAFFFFVLAGKEIITADGINLRISYGIGPLALGKNYPRTEIKALRVGDPVRAIESESVQEPVIKAPARLEYRIKTLENQAASSPASPAAVPPALFNASLPIIGCGLVFDYQGKPVRFARSLNREEAEYLLEMFKLRGYAD